MANAAYRQIAEDLRDQIESEELRLGQQLATEHELLQGARDHES